MSTTMNRTARKNLSARKREAARSRAAARKSNIVTRKNPASPKSRVAEIIDGLNATALHTDERGQLFYSEELLDSRNENVESSLDYTVIAHYFGMGCHWFVTEFDATTGIAWGFACLQDPTMAEWGTFQIASIEELGFPVAINTPTGLVEGEVRIERNQYWSMRTIAELKNDEQYGHILVNA